MSVTPPNQSFQYLQGWLPGQDFNVLPILAGKGDKNQDQYLEGGESMFLLILSDFASRLRLRSPDLRGGTSIDDPRAVRAREKSQARLPSPKHKTHVIFHRP